MLSVFVALGAVVASAQKYGHLNFGTLISSLPATEAANAELKDYQDQLNKEVSEKAATWQDKARAFAQKAQSGEMAPVEQQQQQEALEKEREEIIKLEDGMRAKVSQKRSELLEPIINKAEAAIQAVAKANGYVMIFDTSMFNAILFAQDSDDVMPLVKAELGVEDTKGE